MSFFVHQYEKCLRSISLQFEAQRSNVRNIIHNKNVGAQSHTTKRRDNAQTPFTNCQARMEEGG